MDNTKVCSKCKETKDKSQFSKNGQYLKSHCKKCISEKNKKDEKGKERQRQYRKNLNAKAIDITEKKCSVCELTLAIDNFAKEKTAKSGYQSACKSCKYEQNKPGLKKYAKENKEHIKAYQKEYKKEHRAELNAKSVEYHRKRMETDPNYRKVVKLRKAFNRVVTNYNVKKTDRMINLLGCSLEFFDEWIEFQFNTSMTWDNYGEYWHYDHVVPCASFDFSDDKSLGKCNHWTNLQPLEGSENCSKNDSIDSWHIFRQELKVKAFIFHKFKSLKYYSNPAMDTNTSGENLSE
ncbi:hypothetical protein BNJ_00235 [Kaumoebavirus]|uniref:endonuclease VII n=1 Tax=Kaumoebavirus TaxID=1859492 RepID=UPI0009C3A22F|nr:endonuclease VII [Kaumoebavirus]ARA72064.1 hypothetical protein BNJ_00235 [Kaumoebavirus]